MDVCLLSLGFDLSTQGIKGIALDKQSHVILEERVDFDEDLSHYQTNGGVHRQVGGRVTAPVLMWVEALDMLLLRMKEKGLKLENVTCLSCTAQQHGSVYWRAGNSLFRRMVFLCEIYYNRIKYSPHDYKSLIPSSHNSQRLLFSPRESSLDGLIH
jgi:sugar (pentulose or hexulose) kinase